MIKKAVSEKPTGLSSVSDKSKKTLVAPPPTTAAQATEVKENTSKQELVNAIRKIVGRDDQALKNHPELALLTGHLEQLQPGNIPDLVAESAFVQEALSAGDIGKFLAQPVPASQFLKLLNVDTDAFAGRLPETVDFSQMVTPIGVLKAINVDPQIVASELKALSDNLHLSDGLSGYMSRAAKMQSVPGAQVAEQQVQVGSPLANGAQINVPEVTTAEKMKADKYKALVEALGVKGLPADLLVSDENENSLNSSMIPANPAMSNDAAVMNQYAAAGLNPAAAAAQQQQQQSQQSAVPVQHTQKVLAPISTAQSFVAATPSVPTAPQAGFDPYSAMIAKLSNVQTEKTSFEGDVTKTTSIAPRAQSLEEQLMSSRITAPALAADANTLNPATPALEAPQAGAVIPELKLSEKDFESSEELVGELAKPASLFGAPLEDMNVVTENGAKATNDITPTDKPSIVRLVAPLGEKSNSSSQEQSQDMSGDSKNEDLNMGIGSVHQAKQGATAAKTSTTSFAESLADKTMSNVKQDIINHSQMMLKNGGGSVTLDLGSKEHGKLEVALDIKNNNIDIKILTGSEHMRDLLQQELPKLRESLTSQNLNLKGVEVGVGNGSAWQQASQQQQQGFQNQQAQQSWQLSQAPRSGGYQVNKAFQSNWQAPAVANHRGQIQVWA